MKKIFALFIVMILMNCEIEVKPREARAGQLLYSFGRTQEYQLVLEKKIIDSVEYHVYVMGGCVDGGVSTVVMNHTKEKLEIELLKLQIEKEKK